ncbi:MAG TPA: DUF4136 domain-containing protein [Nitrospira sp.]|nr:DUF4136 domain-containing protein [Nitrospira sp.]
MGWRLPLYGMLLAAWAAGCSSPKVGYDYDRSADFNRYHTYAWVAGVQVATGDRRLDSSLVDARIRTTVDRILSTKGYMASRHSSPDFFVAYHAGMKDMMKGASTQNYIGDRAHGTFTTISDIQPYHEGTLTIDIVDAASRQLIWQASAYADVDQSLGPEERDARMNSIVRAMLSHFPPP